MSVSYTCENKCCTVKIKPYVKQCLHKKGNCKKAGVFIFDPKEKRVLLVQSRGHLFGPPKGSLRVGEQERHCAVREVKEETGLNICSDDFTRAIKVRNRAIYYYLEMETCDISIQNIKNNDANGITWIKLDCLVDAVLNGNIVLSHHAKIVFHKLFGIIFPRCNWTVVHRKRRSK